MSHTPHELADEFPDKVALIHELKTTNPHFMRLADEYHAINREIHRVETRVEPTSDEVEHELRLKRLRLKDEIADLLAKKSA